MKPYTLSEKTYNNLYTHTMTYLENS